MGKRIITRARGHGSLVYRVRRKAFSIKPRYIDFKNGDEFEIVKLISSAGHSAPLAKLKSREGKIFFNIAAKGLYEGQKIKVLQIL